MLAAAWRRWSDGREMRVKLMKNRNALGRLLEELSWESNARKYREGGRGLETVS